VSHRQIHKITMSHRQKYDEQCFPDQVTNEECPTDKCAFFFHGILYAESLADLETKGCLHLQPETPNRWELEMGVSSRTLPPGS
jgi:hypothetical protein